MVFFYSWQSHDFRLSSDSGLNHLIRSHFALLYDHMFSRISRQEAEIHIVMFSNEVTDQLYSCLFCLSSSLVLCTLCCQCLWIVFIPCLQYPMLPVSLVCLHPLSCVPYVASVSGLSSSLVLCTLCC